MEAKTIGKFITTLRKANGMTQKELAEKLNVSDKTISRWERDEGAPDLSVIPVIAEIFGVTCDELLRGERKPASERNEQIHEEPSARGEKQRQRILVMGLSRYRSHSFITIGISVMGLIAAMICNLGFLRAYIGFFVGSIFSVVSLLCQAIFLNTAFVGIAEENPESDGIKQYKTSLIHLAKRSVCFTLTLWGGTLPLIVIPYDTYSGVEIISWFLSGLLSGLLVWMLCGLIWYFLHVRLLKSGICILKGESEEVFWYNHRLKRTCSIAAASVLVLSFAVQFTVNEVLGPMSLAAKSQFHDYDSFVEFMELDVPYYETSDGGFCAAEPLDSIYYDEYGNEITGEEALREDLTISDGSAEGKVVCSFVHRNHGVIRWQVSHTEDGLPVTVITQQDYHIAERMLDLMNTGFVILYIIEMIASVLVYRRKRMK